MSLLAPSEVNCRVCGETFQNLRLLGKHRKSGHCSTSASQSRHHASSVQIQQKPRGAKRSFPTLPNGGNEHHAPELETWTVALERTVDDHNIPSNRTRDDPQNEGLHIPPLQERVSEDLESEDLDYFSTHGGHHMGVRKLGGAVYSFYKCFDDTSEEIFPGLAKKDRGSIDKIPSEILPLVEHCMPNRMSRQSICTEYAMVVSILEACQDFCNHDRSLLSHLNTTFTNARSFANRVSPERRLLVSEQGWRRTLIKNKSNVEQLGVFIPIMRAIQIAVQEGGGIEKAVEFKETCNSQGKRTFSRPRDSDAMKLELEQSWRYSKKRIYFTLYCDGTMMAKSGAGNGTVCRMRIDNMPGLNQKWFDVGIAPIFDLGAETASDSVVREGRLELFPRFLFLLSETASHNYSEADS